MSRHEPVDGVRIRAFEPRDEAAVVDLWRRCGLTRPWNDPHADIRRKLALQPELFLVAALDGAIVGSVMAGYEGHRGWINYLGVAPEHRRRGLGRELMRHAEAALGALGCPKINLQMRLENREAADFYARLGYAEDAVRSFGKRLVDDEAE